MSAKLLTPKRVSAMLMLPASGALAQPSQVVVSLLTMPRSSQLLSLPAIRRLRLQLRKILNSSKKLLKRPSTNLTATSELVLKIPMNAELPTTKKENAMPMLTAFGASAPPSQVAASASMMLRNFQLPFSSATPRMKMKKKKYQLLFKKLPKKPF